MALVGRWSQWEDPSFSEQYVINNNLGWFHYRAYCFCMEALAHAACMCTSVVV